MKKCAMIRVAAFTLLTVLCGALPVSASGPIDACTIVTKADAESLFNDRVASQRSAKTKAPAGNACAYFFKQKGGTYSIKVKVSSSEEIKNEGIFMSARDVFDRQKRARMANPDTAQKMKTVPGLGEEAFWNGYDLWIVTGGYLLTMLAHGPLAGSFPGSEAMEKARTEQDYNLTYNAAMKVISRVK